MHQAPSTNFASLYRPKTTPRGAKCREITRHFVPLSVTVGYANVGLRQGSKMVGASFNEISGEGMDLTNLAPIGYEDVDLFKDEDHLGTWGEFIITIINKNGGIAVGENGLSMQYVFTRAYEEGEWAEIAEWYFVDDDSEPISKDQVVFDAGQGLLFDVDANAYPEGVSDSKYSLSNAGEAMMDSGLVPLRQGSKSVVAPLSSSVDLVQIEPVGYEDVDLFKDEDHLGTWGEFIITIINKNGGIAVGENGLSMQYVFTRAYEEGEWAEVGEWYYVDDDSEPIAKGQVVFPLGQGLLVDVDANAFPAGVAADKYSLSFPGIDDLKD